MFCKNCGKQIDDKAAVCIHCGVATDNMTYQQPQYIQPTSPDVMTGGLVALCILVPVVGLIYGVVQQSNGKPIVGKQCIKISLIVLGIGLLLSVLAILNVFATMSLF